MIRANVYSLDTLDDRKFRAIEEGLDLLGSYIGQTIAAEALKIRLPQDQRGRVNPKRVGVGQLDKMVELHLMAVPLTDSLHNGVAFTGTGVSFVDPNKARAGVASTTSHEAAHSLGFLRPDSWQRDIHSRAHCCSRGCIMHKTARDSTPLFLEDLEDELAARSQPTFMQRLGLRLTDQRRDEEASPQAYLNEDFCSPCQRELGQYGKEHLDILRMSRLATGEVSRNTPVALTATS